MTRFSAIVPNYNDAKRIGASLASLWAQTRPFDEIIVIDDASTDDSVAIIEQLIAGHPNTRLMQNHENRGVVATINRGIDKIGGDFVLLASANDSYHPRTLELAEQALVAQPELALLCGNAEFNYTASGERRVMRIPLQPQYYSPTAVQTLLQRSPLTFFGGAVLLKTVALRQVQGLLAELRWNSDWLAYYLLALRHGMWVVPEALVQVTIASSSYSESSRRWSEQREVIRALITLLPNRFPQEMALLRRAAILPSYDIRALPLLLFHPALRYYLTPLLIWRLLAAGVLNQVKRLFPHATRQKLRRWVKL